MAWKKCPDCGKNVNGESAFYEHVKEQHPIRQATRRLADRRQTLADAELQLEKWLDYATALDGDLLGHVRKLVEDRVESMRRRCWPDGYGKPSRPETDSEAEARLRWAIDYWQEQYVEAEAELQRLEATDGN